MFCAAGGLSLIIPYNTATNLSGERTYSTPWDRKVYEAYAKSVEHGTVVLVVLYSDGTTLLKSVTQSAKFYRLRFSKYLETWNTIAIAATTKTMPASFPSEPKPLMSLQLVQRFFFKVFCDIIRLSYTVSLVNSALLMARIFIIVCDQPKERSLLCLKGHDSYMYCTLCCLPSRFPCRHSSSHTTPYSLAQTSDDESIRQSTGSALRSSRNTNGQLDTYLHEKRKVAVTVQIRINISRNTISPFISQSATASLRLHLLINSAHDLPTVMAAFSGLCSTPFSVYDEIAFDTLHVVNLGVMRQVCDMADVVLRLQTTLPLNKVMEVVNNR